MGTDKRGDDSQDPTTIVGFLFRVVDKPHRVIGLTALLALPSGIAVEATSSSDIAGVSPGWIGAGVSAVLTVTLGVARGVRKIREGHTKKVERLAKELFASMAQEQQAADNASTRDNQGATEQS